MPISAAPSGSSAGVVVKVTAPARLVFLSGISANPIEHGQPMSAQEARVPSSIDEQVALCCDHLDRVLAAAGTDWTGVAKIILYLVHMGEWDAVRAAMEQRYGTAWSPAFTTVQVDNLVAPGARVQFDVIAAA